MTRTISIAGNTSRDVRLADFALVESARNGEVGSGGFDVDSPAAAFDINPHVPITVTDSDAGGSGIVWRGYAADRDIARGPFRVSSDRQFDLDLVDLNTLLGDRVLRTENAKRPAETDIQRVTWLSNTNAMTTVFDNFNIGSTGSKNMDKADYRGRYARDVLNDCAEMAGKLFFAYYDSDTDEALVFYDIATAANYTSTLAISTVLAEVDGATVFAPRDITRRMDGGRIYSGVEVKYNGGKVFVQDQSIQAAYRRREISIYDDRIKTAAKARARGEKYLEASAAEEEVIRCEVDVPSSLIADGFRTGQRVSIKAPHLGISSPVYRRVVHREVKPRGEGDNPDSQDYTLVLELSNPKTVRWSNFGTAAPENDASQGGSSGPPPPGGGEAEACEFIDTFTRTVSDGLGSSDFGVPWTNITGAADRDVNGSHVVFTSSTNNQDREVEWNSSELVSTPWWTWPDGNLEPTIMYARFMVTSEPSTGSFDFHFKPGSEQWALRFSGGTLDYGYVSPNAVSIAYALDTYYIAAWDFDGVDRQLFAIYEEGTEPDYTAWVESGTTPGDSIFGLSFYNDGTVGTSTIEIDYIKFCPRPPCVTFEDFNRTESPGWGTSLTGFSWTQSIGSGSSVDGSYGVLTHPGTAGTQSQQMDALGGPWIEEESSCLVRFQLPSTIPTTPYSRLNIQFRDSSARDGGDVNIVISSTVGNVNLTDDTTTKLDWVADGWYLARIHADHIDHTVEATVWHEDSPEPTEPTVSGATDAAYVLDSSTEMNVIWAKDTGAGTARTVNIDYIDFCNNPPDAPLFGQEVQYEFVAVGDGVTTAYFTNYPYRPGTLRIFVDMLPEVNVVETNPTTGAFTITGAPFNTEEIYVSYQGAGS